MTKTLFHPFLVFLAHVVHSQLVEEMEYLRIENRIMRSKLGRQVRVKREERTQLLRFGKSLGPRLKNIISIVSYATFRNWAAGRI